MLLIVGVVFWGMVATAGPDLTCPAPIFHFGIRSNDQGEVRAEFAILNRGDQPAEIDVDPMGCGCSVVTLSTNAIPPGGQALLTAALSMRGREGAVIRRFVVRSKPPHQGEMLLGFEGTVLTPARVFPGCLLFGTVTPNAATSASAVVRFGAGTPDAVVGVQIDRAGFTGTHCVVRASREYRVDVATVPAALATDGEYLAEVRVHTAMRGSNAIAIPIRCRVCSSDLIVSPDAIAVPTTFEPPLTLYAMLTYRGTGTLQVLSVEPPRRDIATRIVPMAGNRCRIDLSGIRETAGLAGRSLLIRTNLPGHETVAIPITNATDSAR